MANVVADDFPVESPVDRLFGDALELPAPEREQFVRNASGFSAQERETVLELIKRFENLGDFLHLGKNPFSNSQNPDFTRGEILADRFLVLQEIGRGGMGNVYLADDRILGEQVALKSIRAEWRDDQAVLSRFHEEIVHGRRIAHPNICKTFDLFIATRADGSKTPFFTMEYLPGESLAELLSRQGPLPLPQALQFATQIAAGLDAAHGAGIVHRDLKPANILITAGCGRAVITDFGIAKSTAVSSSSESPAATQSGVLIGAPAYMAPEQLLGEPLSPKTDLFAFAIVFHEMVTGQSPWASENDRREDLLRAAIRRITAKPKLFRGLRNAPKHWEALLQSALAVDPAGRPASASAFVAALQGPPSFHQRLIAIPVSRRSLVLGALAGISVAASAAAFRFYSHRPIASPILMIAPVVSDTNPQAAAALDVVFQRTILQSAHVRILPDSAITNAWQRLARGIPLPARLNSTDTREIALRAGADYVLIPELSRANGEWAIKATLERMGGHPENPRSSVVNRSYSADEPGLIAAASKTAEWVRAGCGETADELSSRSRAPEDVTTNSWEALREYTLALESKRDKGAAANGNQAAQRHLVRALEIDPQFAQAAAELANLQTGARQLDEALLNYERAANLIDRRNLTDRESFQIRGLFALDSGQYKAAEQIFGRYAEAFPDSGLPMFYQARAVENLGNPEGALRLNELAVAKDPNSIAFVGNRANRYLFLGRFKEARKDLELAVKLDPSNGTDQTRFALAIAAGNMAAAWQTLEHMRREGNIPFRSRAMHYQACLRSEQNRWPEAQALLEAALQLDRTNNLPIALQLPRMVWLAQLFLAQERKSQAISVCEAILAANPGIRPTLDTGAILAQAGALDAARSCLPSQGQKRFTEWPVYSRRILRLEAELALASGRYAEALQLISSAPPPEANHEWPDTLLRAAFAAAQSGLADPKLKALLENPAAYFMVADINPPGFLRRALAQAKSLQLDPAKILRIESLFN